AVLNKYCLTFQPIDRRGKLLEHLRPAEFGAAKRLLAEAGRDFEARVLEVKASAIAIRFKSKTHSSIAEFADRPREGEPVRRLALEHLALDDESLELDFRLRRHAEREAVTDARLEIVGIHPLGERGALGDRSPNLVSWLRKQNFSL